MLCTLACTIAEKCKQMIIESVIPFDKIYNLFVSATNILLISRSPSECLNFCDVLSDTLTVLRAGCRRHFIYILLLFCKCLEVCPPSLLVDDIVNEAFQSLLDASFIHHYPQLVAVLSPVLKNDTVLEGKYESSVSFYRHFYLLAKALKSPDKNINLLPLLHLMELDESMALALCPYVFKKIKIFGCSHEALLHLLRTQPPTVLDQVYQHLTEFISPLKTTNIDPMMADLLVDEAVIDAVKDHLHCDDTEVCNFTENFVKVI